MKANYKCTQDELYEACELLAMSLKDELATFADFKVKYTTGYVSDFETKIYNAKMLPDEDQRTTEHELMRVELTKRLENCLNKLNALRLYIREAYADPVVEKIRLEEAGFNDYEQAAKANWEKLVTITNKAMTFITDQEATLMANDNMPPTFKAAYSDTINGLDDLVTEYLNKREGTKISTQQKINANNEIFEQAMDICRDGAYLFAKDEARRAQFLWTSILEIVTPPGAAGMRGTVKNGVTFEFVSGVSIQMQLPEQPIKAVGTNAEGKYDFGNLPTGNYTGTVTADGYQPLSFEVSIQTGVTTYKHFTIMPVSNE